MSASLTESPRAVTRESHRNSRKTTWFPPLAPSPRAWRPDFPGAAREDPCTDTASHHGAHTQGRGDHTFAWEQQLEPEEGCGARSTLTQPSFSPCFSSVPISCASPSPSSS